MSRLTFVENFDDNDNEVDSENIQNSKAEGLGSPWLARFLSTRRGNDIGDQFDYFEYNEPIFFEEFSSRFIGDTANHEIDETPIKDEHYISETHNTPYEKPKEKIMFKLFNLPWSITSHQILLNAANHGVTFTSVTLEMNKKTQRPAGTAMAEVDGDVEASEILKALEEKDFHGRPLGIKVFEIRAKSGRQSDASRYFSDDISCKCYLCGMIGHKQVDCTNPPMLLPCHLCAGSDHEASNCPNITCYRCGEFGHHIRNCNNHRFTRVCICTACGYNTHETRNCPLDPAKKSDYLKRLEHPRVRCMVCNNLGHSLCKPVLPSGSQMIHGRQLYCFNCGLEGHNIDMADSLGHDAFEAVCTQPRAEAYSKISLLMNTLELPVERQQEAYDKIARSCNMPSDVIANMFPCLPKPKPTVPRNESKRDASYLPQNDTKRFITDLPFHEQLLRDSFVRQGSGDWGTRNERDSFGSDRGMFRRPPEPPRSLSARPRIESFGSRQAEESFSRRFESEVSRSAYGVRQRGELSYHEHQQSQQHSGPYSSLPRVSQTGTSSTLGGANYRMDSSSPAAHASVDYGRKVQFDVGQKRNDSTERSIDNKRHRSFK